MKSPMLQAIEATVKEQLGDVLTRIKDLEKKIDKLGDGSEVTLAELDKTVKRTLEEALENDLPDRINQAVLQMLASPAKASKGGGRRGRRLRPSALQPQVRQLQGQAGRARRRGLRGI